MADEDRAEFLREAQAQLANVLDRGDIEAVRWMARTAEGYHDNQESCADSMGVPESAEYHRKRRVALAALAEFAPSSVSPALAYQQAIRESVGKILSQHAADLILKRAEKIHEANNG